MEELYMSEFFKKSPIAYSCHKAIFNNQGIPCDYEFLLVNDAFEKLIKVPNADIIHKKFNEVFPPDWEIESNWRRIFDETSINQTPTHFDIHNDSLEKWIRISVFPMQPGAIGCAYHDVTNEYMLENEIEGILKVNFDILCIIDEDGTFIKVSHAIKRILGYDVEELQGEDFTNLVHPEDVQASTVVFNKIKEQKIISSFVNRIRGKDGIYRYIEWHSQLNGRYIYIGERYNGNANIRNTTI